MEQEDGKTGRFGDCSEAVIGACIEVHRHLGPGLLESTYEHCVAHELGLRGLRFERQRGVQLAYKGTTLECGYRLDLVVENELVVEIKCLPVFLFNLPLRSRGVGRTSGVGELGEGRGTGRREDGKAEEE